MAVLDLQEQEQIEAFKAWWKENRYQLIGALLIVIIAVGGWRGWLYYQNKQSVEASTLYFEFTQQIQSNDAMRINDAAAVLTNKYASSAYASRAALMAAQMNEHLKDITQARAQLQWVIDHAGEPGLNAVARLRLASILLDEKNHAGALLLLEAEHPASFDGLFADIKGDVLSAQDKNEEAKMAYQTAISKTDARSMYRNLIQLKLDALVVSK